MQTSEFLHLLGHSSGSAGSCDVFRGRWHHTAISGILLLRGVLSRAWWGCFLCVFLLLLRFSVPAASAILNRTFRIFHRNFVIFVRRLLDVTIRFKKVTFYRTSFPSTEFLVIEDSVEQYRMSNVTYSFSTSVSRLLSLSASLQLSHDNMFDHSIGMMFFQLQTCFKMHEPE